MAVIRYAKINNTDIPINPIKQNTISGTTNGNGSLESDISISAHKIIAAWCNGAPCTFFTYNNKYYFQPYSGGAGTGDYTPMRNAAVTVNYLYVEANFMG